MAGSRLWGAQRTDGARWLARWSDATSSIEEGCDSSVLRGSDAVEETILCEAALVVVRGGEDADSEVELADASHAEAADIWTFGGGRAAETGHQRDGERLRLKEERGMRER